MGSWNSRERGGGGSRHRCASTAARLGSHAYKLSTDRTTKLVLKPGHDMNGLWSATCNGDPIENKAVHDGAVLGIASAGTDEFVTCGEDKTVHLHSGGTCGSFRSVAEYTGHSKPVSRAVYGQNSELLYSCSRDTTIRQWNRRGGDALQVFEGHKLACSAVALGADEKNLCSGSRDASIRLWDVETGACKISATVPRNLVTCLKYAPPTSAIASSDVVIQGGEDLKLRVWDFREGRPTPALIIEGYTYFPLCLDVSTDGFQMLTSSKGFAGFGCEAKLWDIRTSSILREYTGHKQDAMACAFLPVETSVAVEPLPSFRSSRMIITASKDETIKLYDQETGNLLTNHVNLGCGGYTGLAVQEVDPTATSSTVEFSPGSTLCEPERNSRRTSVMVYASTITGGLYALRLEREAGMDGAQLQLRCTGFVQGNAIL